MKRLAIASVCFLAVAIGLKVSNRLKIPVEDVSVEPNVHAHSAAPQPPAIPNEQPRSQDLRSMIIPRAEDAPSWTIPYREEFWRYGRAQQRSSATNVSNLDLGDIIDRVSHAVVFDDNVQLPVVKSQRYSASFDQNGLSMVPNKFVREEVVRGGADVRSTRTNYIYEADPQATLQFRTVSVRSGDTLLYDQVDTLPWAFVGNTAQRLLNEQIGLLEHYQSASDGIEATWVIQTRPVSQGSLTIEVYLGGLRHTESTSDGHLLADSSGKPRILIGQTTVVDANGAKLNLPTQVSGETLSIELSELALGDLAFPVAIDPTISPAFGVGPVVKNRQEQPAVSWNSSAGAYLVVWQDNREQTNDSIYGARVADSGRVIDSSGFKISVSELPGADFKSCFSPRVASDGTDWLVVWQRETTPNGPHDIEAGVVNQTTSTRLAICNQAAHQCCVDVGAVGPDTGAGAVKGEYLVTWVDTRAGGNDVYGSRVNPARTVDTSDVNGRRIAVVSSEIERPHVAGNGSTGSIAKHLVVWADNASSVWTVKSKAIPAASGWNPDIVPIKQISQAGDHSHLPSVAGRNGSWAVAWLSFVTDWPILFKTVDADGNPNASSTTVTTSFGGDKQVVIAGSGSGFLVAWVTPSDMADIRGARLKPDGYLRDVNGFDICTDALNQVQLAIASNGFDYFVTWAADDSTHLGDSADIYAARVTSSGAQPVRDNFPVNTAGWSDQRMLHVSVPRDDLSGTEYSMIVWEENRKAGEWEIYGARLRFTGPAIGSMSVLDINARQLSDSVIEGGYIRVNPKVSSDRSKFYVVWENNGDIWGSEMPQSEFTAPVHFPVCTLPGIQRNPAIASYNVASSQDRTVLVVWEDDRNYPVTGWDIWGALIWFPAGGGFNVPQLPVLAGGPGDQLHPSVANPGNGLVQPSGSPYLLVWDQPGGSSGTDVWGRRISYNGEPLGVPLSISTHSSSSQSFPSVAANLELDNQLGGFAVVWNDERNGQSDVYGTYVSISGAVGSPNGEPITTYANREDFPALARSSGSSFFVVWQHHKTIVNLQGARLNISGNVLSVDQTVNPPTGIFAVNADPAISKELPSVGYFGAGIESLVNLVAYQTTEHYKLRFNLVRFP